MKVVFDSNIFIAALVFPGAMADRALRAAIAGEFELAVSRPIIDEVLVVLARKFARDREELSRAALFLASLGEVVVPGMTVDVLTDEPDNRILECAITAKADVIVTGDRAMLGLRRWEGIAVIGLRDLQDSLGPGSVPALTPIQLTAVRSHAPTRKMRGRVASPIR